MIEILGFESQSKTIINLNISEAEQFVKNENNFLWVDIQTTFTTFKDKSEKSLLKESLKIHELSIEDCISESRHPKIEDCGHYLLLVLYNLEYEKNLSLKKIGLFLGKNYIVTLSKESINEIISVKNTFKAASNSTLNTPVGIFHSIIDHMIDGYLPVIDNFDIQLSKIEEKLYNDPYNTKMIKSINYLRKSMNIARYIIVRENEIFYSLIKNCFPHISEDKKIYFRDIYDHLERDLAKIESLKDSISSLLSVQMNISSQNLNEIMKFLTVISTIFLPATLIAGIFGMNFEKIPFLHSDFGLIIAMASMVAIAISMLIYFKKKNWI